MVKLNKPTNNDTSDDVSSSGGDANVAVDKAAIKAQEIMDSIADQPDVCHALYGMLEEKYSSEEGGSSNPTEEGPEMNTEGMDEKY